MKLQRGLKGDAVLKGNGMLKRFLNDESGATAIEYSLLAGLIAVVIVTGAGSIGNMLGDRTNTVADVVTNATFN